MVQNEEGYELDDMYFRFICPPVHGWNRETKDTMARVQMNIISHLRYSPSSLVTNLFIKSQSNIEEEKIHWEC